MNENKYLECAKRTLSSREDVVEHMIIGISTEAGELLDAYKKHKFYKRELDIKNIKEEIGDLCWYLYQLCDEINYSMDEARTDNIEKLLKRYPHSFNDVLKRDVDSELSHIKKDIKFSDDHFNFLEMY